MPFSKINKKWSQRALSSKTRMKTNQKLQPHSLLNSHKSPKCRDSRVLHPVQQSSSRQSKPIRRSPSSATSRRTQQTLLPLSSLASRRSNPTLNLPMRSLQRLKNPQAHKHCLRMMTMMRSSHSRKTLLQTCLLLIELIISSILSPNLKRRRWIATFSKRRLMSRQI